jgi:hypothetical protein
MRLRHKLLFADPVMVTSEVFPLPPLGDRLAGPAEPVGQRLIRDRRVVGPEFATATPSARPTVSDGPADPQDNASRKSVPRSAWS